MVVKPSKTPVAKYIKRVYLNGINNFFVEGNEFELPDKLIDVPDCDARVIPYIPSAPKSSDNSHFKFDNNSMFEGFGYALKVDDESFALSKLDAFLRGEHKPEMQRILGKYKGKNKK